MAKKQNSDDESKLWLAIYLLKPEMVSQFEKLKNGRQVLTLSKPLEGEFIAFPSVTGREPGWVDTVRNALEEPSKLVQLNAQSPGGLLIVKRESDTFVLSFGHAWQKLQDPWLEPDFGLRVALNSIPPNQIVEIRAEQVFSNWHIASERAPRATFVRDFGVEFDRDLVATLNGVPTINPIFGDQLRGGTSLHVKRPFSELAEILDETATAYRNTTYKTRWPEIANVTNVKDLGLIEKLDKQLDSEFESGVAEQKLVLFTPAHRHSEDLQLAHSYVYGRMSAKAGRSPYLMLGSWLRYLEGKKQRPSTATAKENTIHFLDDDNAEIKDYRIYDCFGYELSVNKRPYILSSGVWYEVKADFLSLVNEYVTKEIKAPPITLPNWDEANEDEDDYNERCGNASSFLHFDCKDVMYGGGHSRFEFCDFMHPKSKTLFFAKIASRSSGMSHLVEQVRRTAELLFNPDQTYRNKLSEVFKKQHSEADRSWLEKRPKNSDWKLCLVSLGREAKDLPFFAKSALWRLHRKLTASDHQVFFVSV